MHPDPYYLATNNIYMLCMENNCFNPFVPNALFLYPLKTCSQGVDKVCIGNEWVNVVFLLRPIKFLQTLYNMYFYYLILHLGIYGCC